MECEHMAEQLHPEDIYQTLEYEIVTLKIKPGETISENQLCKRFGISRTPVRAALQRLEQNGFVQIARFHSGLFAQRVHRNQAQI